MKSIQKLFSVTKKMAFLVFVALIGFQLFSNYNGEKNTKAEDSIKKWNKATVVRVVDGDTIIADTKWGKERVRMIGIDTPESVNPDVQKNTKEGEEASEYTKKLLDKGDTVYLETDKDVRDKYNRLLAYVWLKKCKKATYKQFKKYNIGAIIMQNTYCKAVYYKPNGKYRKWYQKLEEKNEIFKNK